MGNITDAIEKYYNDNYQRLVKKVSYRVGGIPNAEDVVQESFCRALMYHRAYDPKRQQLGGWFNTIINNATRDFKKIERNKGAVHHDEELSEPLDSTMFKSEMVAKILDELDQRHPDQAEALKLYVVLGFTMKEVAEVTNYSPMFVKKLAHSFRQDMREKYGEDMCW